jgi:hypothetical protein
VRSNRFVVMLLWVSFGLLAGALLISGLRLPLGLAGSSFLLASIMLLSKT